MRAKVVKSVTTYSEVRRGDIIDFHEIGQQRGQTIVLIKAYKWEHDRPELPDYVIVEGVEEPGLNRKVKYMFPADKKVGIYGQMNVDAYGL